MNRREMRKAPKRMFALLMALLMAFTLLPAALAEPTESVAEDVESVPAAYSQADIAAEAEEAEEVIQVGDYPELDRLVEEAIAEGLDDAESVDAPDSTEEAETVDTLEEAEEAETVDALEEAEEAEDVDAPDSAALQDDATGNFTDLQNLINNTAENGTLTLNRHYTAGSGEKAVEINKTMTLDLNGATIDRGLSYESEVVTGEERWVLAGTGGNGQTPTNISNLGADYAVIKLTGGAHLTIKDSGGLGTGTIKGGVANKGGGIVISGNSTLTFQSGLISGNAAGYGSAIYMNSGTLNLNGGKITNNDTKYDGQVAIEGGTAVMTGGEIGPANMSGGVLVETATFTMQNGEIKGNHSRRTGGGVRISASGVFTMEGGVISDNTAGGAGGGVRVDEGDFIMKGGSITGNTASGNGGGVYREEGLSLFGRSKGAHNAVFTMEGGVISNNTASGNGGGVYGNNNTASEDSGFTMSGGVISGNRASSNIAVDSVTFAFPKKYGVLIGPNADGSGSTEIISQQASASRMDDIRAANYLTLAPDPNAPDTFSDLQAKIDACPEKGTLTLESNCTADNDESCLVISKTIFLDLNGHTLDRNLSSAAENGCVIHVTAGNLMIKDAVEGGGKITGGINSSGAGAIHVEDGCKLAFAGGEIVNNAGADSQYNVTNVEASIQPPEDYLLKAGTAANGSDSQTYPNLSGFTFNPQTIGYIAFTLDPESTKHLVKFDTLGGSRISSQRVEDGATATKPDAPTLPFFQFDGWYLDAAYATAWNPETPVTENLTIYAKWQDNREEVTYQDASGAEKTEKYYALADGYADWPGGSEGRFYAAPAAQSVTIHDRIEVTGLVNLVLRKGATLVAEQGIHVPVGANLNIYCEAGGVGGLEAFGGDNAGIGANEWEANHGNIHIYCSHVTAVGSPAISYDNNSLTLASDLFFLCGELTEDTDNEFGGPYVSEDTLSPVTDFSNLKNYGVAVASKAAYTIFSNGVINGDSGFEEITCQYTDEGGNTSSAAMETDGDFWRLTIPAKPASVRFISGSSQTDSMPCTIYDIQTATGSENTSLTENGFFVISGSGLLASFVYNNGSGGNAGKSPIYLYIPQGGFIPEPAANPQHGDPSYAFQRWEHDGYVRGEDGVSRYVGVPYDFTTPVEESILLYAIWERSECSVTFDIGKAPSGQAPEKQTVGRGNRAAKPANPVWGAAQVNYVFKCWETAEDIHTIDVSNNPVFLPEGTQYDFNTIVTGNITLRAVWVHEHRWGHKDLLYVVPNTLEYAEMVNTMHLAYCLECGEYHYEAHDYGDYPTPKGTIQCCRSCLKDTPSETVKVRIYYINSNIEIDPTKPIPLNAREIQPHTQIEVPRSGAFTLTAPDIGAFTHWGIINWGLDPDRAKLLSYDSTVTLSVGWNAYVYAFYNDVRAGTSIQMATNISGENLRLAMHWSVPSDAYVEAAGFLATTNRKIGYINLKLFKDAAPKTDNLLDKEENAATDLAMRMFYGRGYKSGQKTEVHTFPVKNPDTFGTYGILTTFINEKDEGPYLYVMAYVNYLDDHGEECRLIAGPVAISRDDMVKSVESTEVIKDW